MNRTAGPVIAICLMLAIVASGYAFYLHGKVGEAEAARNAAEQSLAAAAQQTKAVQVKLTEGSTAIAACQSQLAEANTRAAAAEAAASSAQSRSTGGRTTAKP